jgi:tyrosyl-tRNA synthetase
MKVITDPSKIDEILNRGTIVKILPSKEEFRKKLLSGERLRFYIGFDATAPTLHLSHAKNFILMEKFRRLGHEVIILFGDFTAMIGDPTDRTSARKQLSKKEVISNVKKWKTLIKPLMDFRSKDNPPKIMYNSQWLSKLTFKDLIDIASNFTVQQMIERDMFQKRIASQKPIYLHEFLYPLMQGYDSVAMNVDVEVCGTDQIFNALVGRSLLRKFKEKEKYIVAVTLMENPKTGELMSKSKGVGVFLDATPKDLYGQVMAQPDEMIKILFINNTFLSLKEIDDIIKSKNPRDAKAKLAFEITKILHGEKAAKEAEKEFNQIFKQKSLPSEMPEIILKEKQLPILELLTKTKLVSSKSEAQRLIIQKGVKINNQIQNDWQKNIKIEKGMIVQVGKRRFIKII